MVEDDGEGQPVAVVGLEAGPLVAIPHLDGPGDANEFLGRILFLDAGGLDQEDEGRGRTVENGHFRRIQIDPAIVDAQPAEGRHQVFDGPHLDSVHFETGAHAGIANQHGLGGNILGLGQIDATEDDAGIRGCRAQGQVDLDAAMQADT